MFFISFIMVFIIAAMDFTKAFEVLNVTSPPVIFDEFSNQGIKKKKYQNKYLKKSLTFFNLYFFQYSAAYKIEKVENYTGRAGIFKVCIIFSFALIFYS